MGTKNKDNDINLLEQIKSGERLMNKAIGQMIEQYKNDIIGYFISIGCVMDDAEEFFYEGMSIFVMNVRKNKFRGESSIKTYIMGICKNLWRSNARSARIRSEYIENEKGKADGYEQNDTILMTSDLKSLLRSVLSQLKEKCDKVLSMWAMHYSMSEIAEQLNYANAQVAMNKKNKCMNQLSQLVSDSPSIRKELNNARF